MIKFGSMRAGMLAALALSLVMAGCGREPELTESRRVPGDTAVVKPAVGSSEAVTKEPRRIATH